MMTTHDQTAKRANARFVRGASTFAQVVVIIMM